MNSDKATTIAGAIVALGVAVGVFKQEQAPLYLQVVGYVVAAAIAWWGHQTNKIKPSPGPYPGADTSDPKAG